MAKLPMPFNNPATYKGHSGVDYGQKRGTPFYASGEGVVKTVSKNDRGGYYIWVQYAKQYGSPLVGYHHMDSHKDCPPPGTTTHEGTFLGYVGSLGTYSTGPHLHSEVSGHATSEGYWEFFDDTRVVGDGSTSGGNEKPLPIPEEPEKDDEMKKILLQLDPNQDGRWVLIDYAAGTYWPISNGWQLDMIRADEDNVKEVYGPQPTYVVDGLAAVGK